MVHSWKELLTAPTVFSYSSESTFFHLSTAVTLCSASYLFQKLPIPCSTTNHIIFLDQCLIIIISVHIPGYGHLCFPHLLDAVTVLPGWELGSVINVSHHHIDEELALKTLTWVKWKSILRSQILAQYGAMLTRLSSRLYHMVKMQHILCNGCVLKRIECKTNFFHRQRYKANKPLKDLYVFKTITLPCTSLLLYMVFSERGKFLLS